MDTGPDPATCELPIRPAGPLVLTPPAAGAPLQGIFKTDDPIFLAPAYMQPTPDGSYVRAYGFVDSSIKAYHREGPHQGRSQLISANAGSGQGDVVFNRAVTLAYVQDGSSGELLEIDLITRERHFGSRFGKRRSLDCRRHKLWRRCVCGGDARVRPIRESVDRVRPRSRPCPHRPQHGTTLCSQPVGSERIRYISRNFQLFGDPCSTSAHV